MADFIELQDFFQIASTTQAINFARRGDKVEHFSVRQFLNDHERLGTMPQGLLVDAEFTASGVLINQRVYPGRYVKPSTAGWNAFKGSGERTPLPILKHHDPTKDAIGRVAGAVYEQILFGDAFENDWRKPQTLQDAEDIATLGSGRVLGKLNITDADAIPKVLDGRLATLSVGMRARNLWCSICRQDWVKNGFCDHIPGRVYEVKPDMQVDRSKSFNQLMELADKFMLTLIGKTSEEDGHQHNFILAVTESGNIYGNTDDAEGDDSGKHTHFIRSIVGPNIFFSQWWGKEEHHNHKALVPEKKKIAALENALTDVQKGKKTQQLKAYHVTGLLDYQEISFVNKPAWGLAGIRKIHDMEDSQLEQLVEGMKGFDYITRKVQLRDLALVDSEGEEFIVLKDGAPVADGPERIDVLSKGESSAAFPELEDAKQTSEGNPDMKHLTNEQLADALILAYMIDAGHEINWDIEIAGAENLDMATTAEMVRAKVAMLDEYELTEDQMKMLGVTDKKLTTEARKKISSDLFCGEDRSFPVPDCAHVRNALARLPQSKHPNKAKILSCIKARDKKLKCTAAAKGKDGEGNEVPSTVHDKMLEAMTIVTDRNTELETQVEELKNEAEAREQLLTGVEDQLAKEKTMQKKLLTDAVVAFKFSLNKADVVGKSEDEIKEHKKELMSRSLDSLGDSLQDLEAEAVGRDRKSLSDNEPGGVTDPTISSGKDEGRKPSKAISTPAGKPKSKEERLAILRS